LVLRSSIELTQREHIQESNEPYTTNVNKQEKLSPIIQYLERFLAMLQLRLIFNRLLSDYLWGLPAAGWPTWLV